MLPFLNFLPFYSSEIRICPYARLKHLQTDLSLATVAPQVVRFATSAYYLQS